MSRARSMHEVDEKCVKIVIGKHEGTDQLGNLL
jgi:hypothetical protein